MLHERATSSTFREGTVVVDVRVRPCRAADLTDLEWFGLYSHHREIFQSAFARHLRGENIMLVAEFNNFPVGQAWVDLVKRRAVGIGYIWAVRVFPLLRGLGIGTLLMAAAEQVVCQQGLRIAEVGVEKDNTDARRLYERLGYTLHGELREEYSYTTPDGVHGWHQVDQLILHKQLPVPAAADPS
jgi:ribosomal protein S18 acetylase RimI-like enzyme